MKESIQQEVLFITGTTFATKQWCKKDEGGENNLNATEQFEEACWNGLVQEMLPGIWEKNEENKKLFLWDIKQGKSFIELELAEVPEEKDAYFSIDPYSFFHLQILS